MISRSPVFDALFQSDLTEKAINTPKIEDIEPRVFEEVLRFIYTDEVNQMEEMASNLLAAAEKYMLTLLKEKCEVSLSLNVTVETCSELLLLADRYSALNLKKIVLEFIRFHSADIVKTSGWKTLLQSAPRIFIFKITEIFMSSGSSITTT